MKTKERMEYCLNILLATSFTFFATAIILLDGLVISAKLGLLGGLCLIYMLMMGEE